MIHHVKRLADAMAVGGKLHSIVVAPSVRFIREKSAKFDRISARIVEG